MKRLVVGLMSGTSVDGVDAALIETDGEKFSLLEFISLPYQAREREEILKLCDPKTAALEEICRLNFRLGEIFAAAVLELLSRAKVFAADVFCIGSHGQTIYHIPGDSTLQIGDGAVIAQKTGIVTVADFRPADIAAGGQGAPLIPYFDQLVFGRDPQTSAVQNIGGIGNVTVVGQNTDKLPWLAFDTGPGNMIIDFMAEKASEGRQSFDIDGRMAALGEVQEEIVQDLLNLPYFRETPPKSTGRELFGRHFSQKLLAKYPLTADIDWVTTATAFTAASIAQQYERFILPYVKLDRLIVGGGGSKNPTLLKMLRERLGLPVFVHEDFGISSDAKEAIGFALLADATMHKKPANVPLATGAKKRVILGKVAYP